MEEEEEVMAVGMGAAAVLVVRRATHAGVMGT